MKKYFSKLIALLCLMVLGGANAFAETEIVKSWDLAAIGKANADKTSFYSLCDGSINAGKTGCDLGAVVIEGLFAQGGGNWLFRSAGSLYQGNGGGRIFGINNLKAGDIVTITTNGDYFSGITNAESSFADNTYTWTVTADGMVYGSFARYNYIYKITVEREKTDKPLEPTGKITAVNGVNRTITLGTETPDCEIRYTTDGTEPTTASTLYTEAGIVISASTTIKAIAVKGGAASDVYTADFEAGTTIALATPACYVTTMTAVDDVYYAAYGANVDNSSVLCKPTATLSATFNGADVVLPYAATEAGTLVVTAEAAGYESSLVEVEVKAYTKTLSYDFKSLTAEDLDAAAWGEPALGSLREDKWMNDETVHYTAQSDDVLSTVFPGLTLGKLKETMPSLYIDYGIIWGSTATNYASVSVTEAAGDEIIGVTTNGSYGKSRSTWYTEGSSVSIYRFDTALEGIDVYAPYVPEPVLLYTEKGEVTNDEDYDDYGYVAYSSMRNVEIEAYDGYVIIKDFCGKKNNDLKVTFDEDEIVTSLTLIKNGVEGKTVSDDYFGFSISTAVYAQVYVGSWEEDGVAYSNVYATSDPDSKTGYVFFDWTISDYDYTNEEWVERAPSYYNLVWPQDEVVTVSAAGWASYAPVHDVVVPEDAEVYYASAINAETVTLEQLEEGTEVKAGEGLLVKAEAGNVYFEVTTGAEAIEGNLLVGATEDKELAEDEAYILANEEGEAVFSLCAAGTLAAGKAYLPATTGSEVRSLRIVYGDLATGINNAAAIATEGTAYNLAGQKVGAGYKGIVIVDGKKVIK